MKTERRAILRVLFQISLNFFNLLWKLLKLNFKVSELQSLVILETMVFNMVN